VGEEGLPWLVDAGKLIAFPTTTEVANARHVELAAESRCRYSLDRRANNREPVCVQDIADVLEERTFRSWSKIP